MLRLGLTLALLAGCAGTPAAPDAPPDFALALSDGGGFSGRWTGVEVDASGRATAWTALGADRTTTAADTLSAAALGRLWARLGPAFFATEADRPGNHTARIEATGDGRTHAAVWTPGDRPTLDTLYADLRALLPR